MIKHFLMSLALGAAIGVSAQNLLPGDTSFEGGSDFWFGGSAGGDSGVLRLSGPYCHSDIYYDILKPQTEYTMSFRGRSVSGTVRAKFSIHHVLYGLAGKPETFEFTPEWKSCRVVIPKQSKQHHIYFTFHFPAGEEIEIDELMLNPGTAPQPWEAASPFAVGIAPTGAPGNILFPDDRIPEIAIGAVNYSGKPFRGKLKLSTVDFNGNVCATAAFGVTPESGKGQLVNYRTLQEMRGGFYIVRAELTDPAGRTVARQEMPFGVVPRPVAATPEEASFGTHPDPSRVELAAIPRIGIKWLRTMPHWRNMEYKPGERSLIGVDDEAEELGLSYLYSLKIAENLPAYIKSPDNRLHDYEALRSFIGWLGKTVPDTVRAWEIENEPDLIYPSHMKMPYLDAAAYYGEMVGKAAKFFREARPDLPVAAMSVSGGGANIDFIKTADKGHETDYQILSPHPYIGGRYIGPGITAVSPDAYIRERMISHVPLLKGRKLWAGEVGWAYDGREGAGSETQKTFSNYIARALILMKSVPEVEKIMYFKAQGCYERDNFHYGLWNAEFKPTAAAVFYANVAAKLEHSRPFRPVFESDLRVYTFTGRDGKPFAAIWRSRGDVDKITLALPKEKLEVTDLSGNPVEVAAADGKCIIPVTETPVWVSVAGASAEELVDKLAEVDINIPPVSMTIFYADDRGIAGMLRNNLPRPVRGTFSAPGAKPLAFSLAESGTKSVELQFAGGFRKPVELHAVTASGKSVKKLDPSAFFDVARVANADPAGQFPELPEQLTLAERKFVYPPDPGIGWKSAADLSCDFRTGYDDRYFYVAADVTDPVHFQQAVADRAWVGDALQIAFDTLNDGEEGMCDYNSNDVEFIAWLGPEGVKMVKTFSNAGDVGKPVKDAIVNIAQKGGKTGYRIAIPWKDLGVLKPMAGRLFGLNFIVNQNNGNGRAYWIGLTEGLGEMKYPYLYRKFRLK